MPAEPTAQPRTTDASRLGLRLLASCAGLVGLAFIQTPGAETADTKLDLVVNPAGMLSKAFTMWDSLGAFGQVGNQAYGYFWPMGPVFWAGQFLNFPGWVTQRLWLAIVLVVAFLGFARLLRAFGVRHDLAVILGALTYALSPRMLTTVGPISIEAWPSALAPWVLLALVLGSRQGSPRRYALGAALGVAMVGGVNAAATFAVLPLGVVWLLTRSGGPRRRTLMFWWPVFTIVGCLWWIVPLVVLGRYSPPFLDYIETAAVTTYPTTLFDALRGTTAWIPYVENRWRSGNDLITSPLLILHSTVLLVIGIIGLARRDNPNRTFAATGLAVGLLLVTFGHLGAQEGWFGPEQRTLLDGVLAPFRNVHKFDPVIRIPLVLGLAHVVEVQLSAWDAHRAKRVTTSGARQRFGVRVNHLAVVWLVLIAVAGSAQPAWSGRLAPSEAFAGVPRYWQEATAWVGQDPDARSLLLPASSFGTYIWGRPQDEPIQPLATAPWAVRNAIPLAPVGNIRSLDAIEERLYRGAGSEGLTDYFRRMGIRYLVVRNDLERGADIADPVLVHQALAGSPDISLAKAFGPLTGGRPTITRDGVDLSINQGWQDEYAAIEVFEVEGASAPAVTSSDLPVVVGASEDLLTLSEQDVLDDQPTVLAYDASTKEPTRGPLILTDGMRLRDRFFGRIHDGDSATLTPGEAARLTDRRDYELTPDLAWYTSARLEGAKGVLASSSLSDARTGGGSEQGYLPYAAVDGDPATSWASRPSVESAPSLRLELERESAPESVEVTLGQLPLTSSEIRVRTEVGVSEPVLLGAGESATVPLPDGPTSWIQVEEGDGQSGRQLSIAELGVPGVSVKRWLVPPAIPRAWGAPDVIALDARADRRTGCAQVEDSIRCRPGDTHTGEEASGMRRQLSLPTARSYEPRLTLLPRPGEGVPDLLQDDGVAGISASSRSTNGASASSALAALDGLPSTTWVSSWTDPAPSLDVRWLAERRVTSVTLELDDEAPALRPTHVTVSYPGGSQEVDLGRNGFGAMRPVRTSSLSILIDKTSEGGNIDFDGLGSPLGAGVSELSIGGVPFAVVPIDGEEVDRGCGSGPDLVVNGETFRTAIVGSSLSIHLGGPVDARVCGTDKLTLAAGENYIELGATEAFSPASLVLADRTEAGLEGAVASASRSGSTYELTGGDTFVLRHNTNPGWTASANDQTLDSLVVDGWQQAFTLPDGDAATSSVRTDFAPQSSYRLGLVVGGALLAGCVLLYLLWRRRPGRQDAAPLQESGFSGPLAGMTLLLTAGLTAGWWGFGIAVVATLILVPLLRRLPDVAVLLAIAPIVVVGSWNALQPWGSNSGWSGSHAATQLLMVVPLALLAVVVALPTRRKRDSGRSTDQ